MEHVKAALDHPEVAWQILHHCWMANGILRKLGSKVELIDTCLNDNA